MKKAGFLDKKPLTATRTMLDMAQKDTGRERTARGMYWTDRYTEYESRFYFRSAMADGGILEVDLFTRKDLACGMKAPRFRIFLDRENADFISWNTVDGKWSRARIDMLETGDDRYRYSYRGRNHATKKTTAAVNRYLRTGKQQDVETAVLDFQAGIREAELSRKHRLVTDCIDGYMDTVPAVLPADWKKFINNRVLAPGHAVFYTKETGTGYCTHCGMQVPVPGKAVHNMQGKCGRCGSRATYKAWKKQKRASYRTKASLLQKCTDGGHYVYRQFDVRMYMERENNYVPEICIQETYRSLYEITDGGYPALGMSRKYEWGEFGHTGVMRWCEEGSVRHGAYYTYSPGYSTSVPYTANLKRILRGTALQHIPAAEIMKACGGRISVMGVLSDMDIRHGFPYEALWKAGLKRFVLERAGRGGASGLTVCRQPGGGIKPWECLGITREDMKQASRLDAADRMLRIIQEARGQGVTLTDEQVLWLDRHLGAHVLLQYIGLQTPHRIIRYLKENIGLEEQPVGNNELLRLWADYLDTARQLGYDLRDRALFFPQSVTRAHDDATETFMRVKDRLEAEKLRKTDAEMKKKADGLMKAFGYSDDRYVIRIPGCYADFKDEGQAQHNCVATYYDRAVKGELTILFIRRKEKPEKPFCTAEIRIKDGEPVIIQNKTAYNKEAPEDARAFLEKALQEARKAAGKGNAADVRIRAEA